MNTLYYGDNLDILGNTEYFPNNSVDLIYLDPPFNSKATYNILFKTPNGLQSESQMTAFEDTWHWTEESEHAYEMILKKKIPDIMNMITSFRRFIGQNDMMAYLTMMTIRLMELHRVLKPTGSIYLHCDPTASHYLKIVMDTIFGYKSFRNEIVWCYSRMSSPHQRTWNRTHDIILYYSAGRVWKFNVDDVRMEYSPASRAVDGAKCDDRIKKGGFVKLNPKGKFPDDWWPDIYSINMGKRPERLGYPTQKPVALLERIILASSNKGDIVLDPFCGCGTAIAAAQKLNRKWIGIDITHLAINLIKNRLTDTFNLEQDKDYQVIGEPESLAGAHELAENDKYQFQWWITSRIGARPYKGKKRGADSGIDAVDFFSYNNENNELITESVVISVKGGAVNVGQIRDLKAVVERERAALGFFITLLDPSRPMEEEAVKAGFYEYPFSDRKIRKIQILTVKEILDGKKFDIPGDRFKHTKKAGYEDGTQKGLF